MSLRSLLFVALLLAVAPAAIGLIPPGYRIVESCVTVEDTVKFPQYMFFVLEIRGPDMPPQGRPYYGARVVTQPGQCFSFPPTAWATLVAVPKDQFLGMNRLHEQPILIHSGLKIYGYGALPQSHPMVKMRDVIRIQEVDPTGMTAYFDRSVFTYVDGTAESLRYVDDRRPTPTKNEPIVPKKMLKISGVFLIAAGVLTLLILASAWRLRAAFGREGTEP